MRTKHVKSDMKYNPQSKLQACSKIFALLLLIGYSFSGCKNQVDLHNEITDPSINLNLFQKVSSTPELSIFTSYLVKSGYDKVLASSKTYTVWAPNNAAMQAVSPNILNDSAKLSQFVGNHISHQSYTTVMAQPSLRIKMLNGKSETFTSTTIETAVIAKANQYTSNGILHTITKAVLPKLNIWDYVTNNGGVLGPGLTTDALQEQGYLISQNYSYQDTSQAVIIGIDPQTGKPIPKPGTGIVNKNHFKDQTADLSSEDKQYTFFVLADAGLTTETNKIKAYFNTSSIDSTAKLSNYAVLKDLVVAGAYSFNNESGILPIPDSLQSVFGIKFHVNLSDTIRSYNASNGKVYVMKDVAFKIQDKVPTIIIQGESNPPPGQPGSYYKSYDRDVNTYYRIKNDPNGVQWKDIYIETNSTAGSAALPPQFWTGYRILNMNSVTYKVYIRAINDSKSLFSEQVSFGTPLAATLPYFSVTFNNFSEVALGNYVNPKYGYNSMFVVGSTSTTSGQNSITFDYIKLVPVLP